MGCRPARAARRACPSRAQSPAARAPANPQSPHTVHHELLLRCRSSTDSNTRSARMHGTVPSAASKGQHGSVRCHGSVAHGTAESMPAKDARHVGMTSHGNMPTNHLHALWVDRRAGKCVPDDADDGSTRLPQRQHRGNDGGNLHAAVPRRWLGAAEKCQKDSQALQQGAAIGSSTTLEAG